MNGEIDNLGALLIESLREATAVETGTRVPAHVVQYVPDVETGLLHRLAAQLPPGVTAMEVAEFRRARGWSVNIMATVFNVSPRTIEAWEQGRRCPGGTALRLFQLLAGEPALTATSELDPPQHAEPGAQRQLVP